MALTDDQYLEGIDLVPTEAEAQATLDRVMAQLGGTPDSTLGAGTFNQPVMNIGADFTRQQTPQSQRLQGALGQGQQVPDLQFLRDRGGTALFLDALAQSDAASRGVAAGPRLQDSPLFQGLRPEEIEAMRAGVEGQQANLRGTGAGAIQRGLEFAGGASQAAREHRLRTKTAESDLLNTLMAAKMKMQPQAQDPLAVVKALGPYQERLDDDQLSAILQYALGR